MAPQRMRKNAGRENHHSEYTAVFKPGQAFYFADFLTGKSTAEQKNARLEQDGHNPRSGQETRKSGRCAAHGAGHT
jgi:hypothetical protein